MDQREFEHWQAVTSGSRHMWVEDAVTRMNGRGCLYYSGGESGIYMRITQDGMLQVGNYEGAIPHIGEALFRPGRRENAAVSARRSSLPVNWAAGNSWRTYSPAARSPRWQKREAWHSPCRCEEWNPTGHGKQDHRQKETYWKSEGGRDMAWIIGAAAFIILFLAASMWWPA